MVIVGFRGKKNAFIFACSRSTNKRHIAVDRMDMTKNKNHMCTYFDYYDSVLIRWATMAEILEIHRCVLIVLLR